MSAQYDITAYGLESAGFRPIHAGDDYDHKFTVERPPGSPLNLTGAKLWFTIKRDSKETDAQAQLLYSTDDIAEIEITNAVGGEFTIHLQSSDTGSLEGTWCYDIKAKLAAGNIIRLARGTIEFLKCITHTTT